MRDLDPHISLEMSTALSLEVISILRSPCFAAKKRCSWPDSTYLQSNDYPLMHLAVLTWHEISISNL